MKAFIVSDRDGRGAVVFADTPSQARAWADLDSDYVDRSARRFPEMDGREKTPPTLRELVSDHGWFAFCRCCERSVFADCPDAVWQSDDEVFCSEACVAQLAKYLGRGRA